MKSIFVLGDSISVHYGPYLKVYLDGIYSFHQKDGMEEAMRNLDVPVGGNGGDSRRVLEFVTEKVKNGTLNYDVMTLNCGLHDIKTDPETGEIQVPLQEYEENLRAIVRRIKEAGVTLWWIRTTPVDDEIHNSRQPSFKRYNKDLLAYNAVADQVMKEFAIPMIDLNTFTAKLGKDAFCDHVHYTEQVRALQAAFIVGHLY